MWQKFGLIFFIILTCDRIPVSVGYATLQENITKVLNGTEAGEDPKRYQASIKEITDTGLRYLCAGVLISRNAVLTSAVQLMLLDKNSLTVGLGLPNQTDTSENTLFYDISEIIMHENFNPFTLSNTIGIVKLNGNVPDDNPAIKPIPMTSQKIAVGTKCTVAGYGGRNGIITDKLMIVDVLMQDSTICEPVRPSTGIICASNSDTLDTSVCWNDLGGPLVCNGLLTGIATLPSYGCSGSYGIAVYSDVSYYRQWIAEHGTASKILTMHLLIFVCTFVCSRVFL